MSEGGQNPAAQQLVRVNVSPRSTGRSDHHTSLADQPVWLELLAGEVDFQTADQAVPVVNLVLLVPAGDVRDEQVAAEKVLDHQRCRTALSPRRPLRCPPGPTLDVQTGGLGPQASRTARSTSIKVKVMLTKMSSITDTLRRRCRSVIEAVEG